MPNIWGWKLFHLFIYSIFYLVKEYTQVIISAPKAKLCCEFENYLSWGQIPIVCLSEVWGLKNTGMWISHHMCMCPGMHISLAHKSTKVRQPMSHRWRASLGSIMAMTTLLLTHYLIFLLFHTTFPTRVAHPALSCIWAPSAAIWAPKAPNHDPFRTLHHVTKLFIPQSTWHPSSWCLTAFWFLDTKGAALARATWSCFRNSMFPLLYEDTINVYFQQSKWICNKKPIFLAWLQLWAVTWVTGGVHDHWNRMKLLNWTKNLAALIACPHWMELRAG